MSSETDIRVLEAKSDEIEQRIDALDMMILYLFDHMRLGTQTKDYVEFLKRGVN